VTIRPDGPVLANLLLDGIYPEDLRIPQLEESAGSGFDPRTIPWPRIEVRVLLDGKPAAGKLVFLHRMIDGKPGEGSLIGYIGADGKVVHTFDRVIPSEYAVTVTEYKDRLLGLPAHDEVKALRSLPVPARYMDPGSSGLTMQVRGGREDVNLVTLELKSQPPGIP
jgi:hypothetical protein